jgi:hypothetical protein
MTFPDDAQVTVTGRHHLTVQQFDGSSRVLIALGEMPSRYLFSVPKDYVRLASSDDGTTVEMDVIDNGSHVATEEHKNGLIERHHELVLNVAYRLGWAPAFAATNVVDYLRRATGDKKYNTKMAQRFWTLLQALNKDDDRKIAVDATLAICSLSQELTENEQAILHNDNAPMQPA